MRLEVLTINKFQTIKQRLETIAKEFNVPLHFTDNEDGTLTPFLISENELKIVQLQNLLNLAVLIYYIKRKE